MREISSRFAFKAVAVALVLAGASIFAACGPESCATARQRADTPVKNLTAAQAERAVFCLTNDFRVSQGRTAFTASTLLDGTARRHAQDAVARKWWVDGADTHTTPDGTTPASRIRAAGYCANGTSWQVAENTYWGWGTPLQTPRHAVNWWINSPFGHRDTLLDPNLRELGVGVVLGAPRPGTFPDAAVFVQNFGRCS